MNNFFISVKNLTENSLNTSPLSSQLKLLATGFLLGTCINSQAAEIPTFFKNLQAGKVISDSSVNWVQMGPGMSGNNYLMHFHPSDGNVMFLGPNMGNTYRSVDGGKTYTDALLHDASGGTENRGPVRAMAMDFGFSEAISHFGLASQERKSILWKTENKGKTWSKVIGLPNVDDALIGAIAIHPKKKNIWYIGTGVANNVNAFTLDESLPVGAILKSDGSTEPNKAALWRTLDSGDTWQPVILPELEDDAHIVKVTIDRNDPKYVYVATTDGFYRSEDWGGTFERFGDLNVNKPNGNENHNAIDAILSLDVFYGKASNGSRTGWPTLFAVKQVAYQKDSAGNVSRKSGGVYKSTNRGKTWVSIHGKANSNSSLYLNLTDLKLYSPNKTFKENLAAGWFGTDKATAQNDYTDPSIIMPNYTKVVVNPTNKNNIFVVNDYKAKGGHTLTAGTIWRTDDGGANWYVTLRNGTAWERKNSAGNLEKDGLFWHARQPGKTHNNITWRSMEHWDAKDAYFAKAGSAIGFTADGSQLYLQIAKVVLRSTNKGKSWTEWDEQEKGAGTKKWISGGNSNLPGRDFLQDPDNPTTLYFGSGENDMWVAKTNEANNKGQLPVKRIKMKIKGDSHAHEYSVSTIALHPDTGHLCSLQFRQKSAGKLLCETDNSTNDVREFEVVGRAVGKADTFKNGKIVENPWPKFTSDEPVQQLNLTFNPNNPQIMYFNVPYSANTLNYVFDSVTGVGLYKSIDGGESWFRLDGFTGNGQLPLNTYSGSYHKKGIQGTVKETSFSSSNVTKVILHPTKPWVVFAGVYDQRTSGATGGLFMSTSNGKAGSWKKIDLPRGINSVVDIMFDNAGGSDQRMYVSTGSKSAKAGVNVGNTKGGIFWTSLFNKLGDEDWSDSIFEMPFTGQMAVHNSDENVLLATVLPSNELDHGNPGVYMSTNRGGSWKKINQGVGRSDLINDIAIDINNKKVFYLSTWGSGHFRGEVN